MTIELGQAESKKTCERTYSMITIYLFDDYHHSAISEHEHTKQFLLAIIMKQAYDHQRHRLHF